MPFNWSLWSLMRHIPQLLAVTGALNDETRLRAMLALGQGEICLCQIIELLGLAPSTVSKHMKVLTDAGLVYKRKQGRWQYFRLVGPEAPPVARQALEWVHKTLDGDATIDTDAKKMKTILKQDPQELVACYRSRS
jgi:ArsR family transcriptional regulator